HLQRRHADLVAHRHRGERTVCLPRGIPQNPGTLGWKIRRGRTAEAETPRVQAEALGADAKADLDCADIAGPDENVRERQHAVVVVLVLVDDPTTEPDDARIGINPMVRPDELLFERPRRGDDLERRSRFVEILKGAVSPPPTA